MRISFFISLLIATVCISSAHASAVVEKQKQAQTQAAQKAIEQQQIQNQPQAQGLSQQRQLPRSRPSYPNTPNNRQNTQPRNYQDLPQEKMEVIDIVQLWRELDFSSEAWPLIIDREPKEITIREYIKLYHEKGIYIRKPPSAYVDLIDEMLINRPDLVKTPFKNVLRFAAVVEYDFDNGKDPDQMALKLLGQKVYEENKRRLNR